MKLLNKLITKEVIRMMEKEPIIQLNLKEYPTYVVKEYFSSIYIYKGEEGTVIEKDFQSFEMTDNKELYYIVAKAWSVQEKGA